MTFKLVKSGKIEKTFWKPIIKSESSQEDVFRLYKALPHEIWETRFILSCLPIIRRGIRLFKIVRIHSEYIYYILVDEQRIRTQ